MNSMSEFFDKIYVIHVNGYDDRKENINRLKEQFNTEIEIFNAFTPAMLDIPSTCKMLHTEYACTYSHLALWKKIIQDNPKRPLILEDDAVICSSDIFSPIRRQRDICLSEETDITYLGLNYIVARMFKINEEMSKLNFAYALHAYSPSIRFLKYIVTIKNFNVDELYVTPDPIIDVRVAHILSQFNCVAFNKPLLSQNPGTSIIHGTFKDYNHCLL